MLARSLALATPTVAKPWNGTGTLGAANCWTVVTLDGRYVYPSNRQGTRARITTMQRSGSRQNSTAYA
jgi:hypothetical protein